MARRRTNTPTDDDPTEADLEKFGGVTRPCPECRTELYDDAEVCWKCGHVLSSAPKAPKMVWVVAAIVLLAVFVLALGRVF